MCVSPSPQNCCMGNIYQKHLCSYKYFEIFETVLEKNPWRSSCSQVFCKISFLKKFANFTRKHQCWSHFLIKSPDIKRLQHRCFPVHFAKLLRTSFLQNTSSLSLKKLYIVGVHKKVFEWLAAICPFEKYLDKDADL